LSYRIIKVEIMVRGAVLAIAEKLFPEKIPSLGEYSREVGVAPSTFRRSGEWLLGIIPGLLGRRRPGPKAEEEAAGDQKRQEVVQRIEDLRSWLLEERLPTEKNTCYSPEAKKRIALVSNEVHATGMLDFGEIARVLQIDERQLRRIREEVAGAGGEAPEPESRRPDTTNDLPGEIQKLIKDIQISADTRNPYGPTDVKRILEKNYKEKLERYLGKETIALSTVSKYMKLDEVKTEENGKGKEHPRGSYIYPEPFQVVAIDTSYFKVFGRTFYLITVFEMGGRVNLLSRMFIRENTEAVVSMLEEFISRFPGIEVVVIDRGTPYLNEEVKALLENNGLLRVVCPPEAPTAKGACERHFRTLKEILRPAFEKVFPVDPGWEPEKFLKVLEMGIAVFQELYHQIPQEGIDGKSPAERAAEFDPVRACARMVELFQRSLDSEPAEEYARELHYRFQLPGDPQETVNTLKQFGTRSLRKLAARVEPYMGPPWPDWVYDPLGYLAAKAREIWEMDRKEAKVENLWKAREKESLELSKKEEEEREAKEKEYKEHPERFVDGALRCLGISLENNWLGPIERSGSFLKELLVSLSKKMKGAFLYEIERLRGRIGSLEVNGRGREGLLLFLDEFLAGWMAQEEIPDG
jgi:transposase InsO family protein